MCSQSDDPTQINKMPCGCLTGAEHRRLVFLKPDHEFQDDTYPPIANNGELRLDWHLETLTEEEKIWLDANIQDWREQIEAESV